MPLPLSQLYISLKLRTLTLRQPKVHKPLKYIRLSQRRRMRHVISIKPIIPQLVTHYLKRREILHTRPMTPHNLLHRHKQRGLTYRITMSPIRQMTYRTYREYHIPTPRHTHYILQSRHTLPNRQPEPRELSPRTLQTISHHLPRHIMPETPRRTQRHYHHLHTTPTPMRLTQLPISMLQKLLLRPSGMTRMMTERTHPAITRTNPHTIPHHKRPATDHPTQTTHHRQRVIRRTQRIDHHVKTTHPHTPTYTVSKTTPQHKHRPAKRHRHTRPTHLHRCTPPNHLAYIKQAPRLPAHTLQAARPCYATSTTTYAYTP